MFIAGVMQIQPPLFIPIVGASYSNFLVTLSQKMSKGNNLCSFKTGCFFHNYSVGLKVRSKRAAIQKIWKLKNSLTHIKSIRFVDSLISPHQIQLVMT